MSERRPRFPLALDRIAQPSAPDAPPRPSPAESARRARATSAVAMRTGQAVPTAAPAGLGLDSAGVRQRMADRLRADGVRDERVLAAFATVPRHLFVDPALANQAYEDTSLPIGHGQTISKPSVVARMIELAAGGHKARESGNLGAVLEVGTGCGYQAALLAQLARRVVSVERIRDLHDKARERLAALRGDRVRLVWGDGMLGHPPGAPYDAIVSAAGGREVPEAWLQQLAVGGRLVCPLEDEAGRQALLVVDRHEGGYARHVHEAVRFVPLKSGLAR